MTETDFKVVCTKIDEEREFLNSVSQDIWKMPELAYKEVHAHAVLTSALSKCGFPVEKHYFLTTAFRAEFCVKDSVVVTAGGPTVAILLEYDALPDIGHACGHNLIAEAGLAAAIAVKKVMEEDRNIAGKLVVLGTPAEESGGGKIRLIELGAFEKIDAALMVHPTRHSVADTATNSRIRCYVEYQGKEAHAAASPWEGRNALDAAVACYNSIASLRQQIRPISRIHVPLVTVYLCVPNEFFITNGGGADGFLLPLWPNGGHKPPGSGTIITEGGSATNIIPARSKMELSIRSDTYGGLKRLQSQVESCIKGAATVTGCTVEYRFDEANAYLNMISNKVFSNLFETYSKQMGVKFDESNRNAGSTDMGNVSHVVPSLHPLFPVLSETGIHTLKFAEAARSPEAQEPTLRAAKALALTCLAIMRNKDTLEEAKKQFQEDIQKDLDSH